MKKLLLLIVTGLLIVNIYGFGVVADNQVQNTTQLVAGDEIYPISPRG